MANNSSKFLQGCLSIFFGIVLLVVLVAFAAQFGENVEFSSFEMEEEFTDPNDKSHIIQIAGDDIEVEDIVVENLYENESPTKSGCLANMRDASYLHEWQQQSNRQRFGLPMKVKVEDRCKALQNKENLGDFYYQDSQEYWRKVYSHLYKHDVLLMEDIFYRFEQLQKQRSLNEADFAEAVVNFVQSIPYVLILHTSAEEALKTGNLETGDEFYINYIQRDKRPYVENVKFGLHSPIEFLHSKQGDCDTRTVLVYTLLSHFGYDVVILNNMIHSMIGLNLPASGSYVSHQGKKYYFWETTSYWELGVLPSEYRASDFRINLPSRNDY